MKCIVNGEEWIEIEKGLFKRPPQKRFKLTNGSVTILVDYHKKRYERVVNRPHTPIEEA